MVREYLDRMYIPAMQASQEVQVEE
jgi:hypothetical protein